MTSPETELEQKPRHSRRRILVIAVVILLMLYAASPYYALWRFGEALRARDMDALSARIDFPTVRGSLKQQIREKFLKMGATKKHRRLAEFLMSAEPSLLDQLVDAYVTPEGVADLIEDPARIKSATSLPSPQRPAYAHKRINWLETRYAFFTSPRDFAVEHEGIILRFRFNGITWRLRAIDLQLQAKHEDRSRKGER
jgi:hypothetical protein